MDTLLSIGQLKSGLARVGVDLTIAQLENLQQCVYLTLIDGKPALRCCNQNAAVAKAMVHQCC